MKISKLSSVFAIVLFSLLTVNALAAETLSWTTPRSASEVIEIMKDVAHTCSSGCRYAAPRVNRQGVISGQRSNSMFHWTEIDAPIGTYLIFNNTRVRTSEASTIIEITKVNDEARIAELEQASHKEYDSGPLNSSRVKLTLTPVAAGTKIDAELTVSTSIANGIAQRSLRDAAAAIKANTL